MHENKNNLMPNVWEKDSSKVINPKILSFIDITE